MTLAPPVPTQVVHLLLAWYDRHRRRLPWRALPGETPDPYRVWLSEIMLQQTTVAAVAPYYAAFLARWPNVEALAAAPLTEVLAAWAGLGYYARARNLHRCAEAVVERFGGRFPESEADLRSLPGIGPYTAAAVAAIAFGRQATPVDGNVERVLARLFALTDPLPGVKAAIAAEARRLTPRERAGDFAQAMMDLGATLCLPRQPRCVLCPLHDPCRARALGIAAELPRRAPRAARPTRRGVAFWLLTPDGRLLLRRRPEEGLLGGMLEVPSTPWRAAPWSREEATQAAPVTLPWRPLPGGVRHVFTHFALELEVWAGEAEPAAQEEAAALEGTSWIHLDRLGSEALPSVMRKVTAHALKHR